MWLPTLTILCIAPAEGQISVILGALDCRWGEPREATDFFDRFLEGWFVAGSWLGSRFAYTALSIPRGRTRRASGSTSTEQAVQSRLIKDSDRIRACAQGLEIHSILNWLEVMSSGVRLRGTGSNNHCVAESSFACAKAADNVAGTALYA